jgi:cytidine deaminase
MSTIKNITLSYSEYEHPEELNIEDQELIKAAKEMTGNAYAPYSEFRVGAAVRLESGRIVRGANVENAAFPSGICAERAALASSASNYPDDNPAAIAIAAISGNDFSFLPVSPCGNCRQVIAEEEHRTGKKIRILLFGKDKILVFESIGHLLPIQFSKNSIRTYHP